MKLITTISRILVGALFIFSGLIKANDTLGFSYKLVEYFEVLNLEFFIPFALVLAMVICIFEVVVGVTLLMGMRVKLTLWLLLLMIIFFTFLTFYSAYYQKVLSCGCFGDAIPLTPWESFYKDLILLTLIIILFIGQQHIKPLFADYSIYPFQPSVYETPFIIIVLIITTLFPLYTYNYLPVKDFRPYAIGKNIPAQMLGTPDEVKYFYTLKDKATGEQVEVDAWPENWSEKYDYVTNRMEVTKAGIEPKIKDFIITNLDGADYTQDIIENPDYNFVLIAYDLDQTETSAYAEINEFVNECNKNGVAFTTLTASSKEQIEAFEKEHNTALNFYNCDGTVLKTIIRSNPGLVLMKNGVVIDNWHYHSIPPFSDVEASLK
jgi:uncharacterized membrane protein YphA (DoxX/SURF4 family)